MRTIRSAAGVTVSYEEYGDGPPLVLVHGSFSDHRTNWALVQPLLAERFTVRALARRGRGETSATEGHALEDEGRDVVALLESIGEPSFLLGHSYGAHAALVAAALAPERVRKLVLYEPAWPWVVGPDATRPLEKLAGGGDWAGFAAKFFRDTLSVPKAELEDLRSTELWGAIVADARASLGDLRALGRHDFRAEHLRGLSVPVLLQIGTASPRGLYVTDALAAVLPDVRIEALSGQAHEAMTTAPGMYADSVVRFLCA